ncbi:hypothetical protein V8F20_005039 [Naviculisporaceae sp. PSN 640]
MDTPGGTVLSHSVPRQLLASATISTGLPFLSHLPPNGNLMCLQQLTGVRSCSISIQAVGSEAQQQKDETSITNQGLSPYCFNFEQIAASTHEFPGGGMFWAYHAWTQIRTPVIKSYINQQSWCLIRITPGSPANDIGIGTATGFPFWSLTSHWLKADVHLSTAAQYGSMTRFSQQNHTWQRKKTWTSVCHCVVLMSQGPDTEKFLKFPPLPQILNLANTA